MLSVRALSRARGCILPGLNPGGIAEMFHTQDAHETVFLRHRKGFVKLAIQHGVPLVPGYCFGNTAVCVCVLGWACVIALFSYPLLQR